MRHSSALIALAVIAAACAADDGTSDGDVTGATTTQVREEEMPDASTPDESSGGSTEDTAEEPPTAAADEVDRPEDTLVLNPTTTARSAPSTTAGKPIGGDESLFAGQFDPGLDPFVKIAVADLAVRLGVAEEEIAALSATLVTWSDSSMGCPLPDMEYLQVLQDGSLIELGYGSKVYRYHTGGDRITPFLCDQPLASPPAVDR